MCPNYHLWKTTLLSPFLPITPETSSSNQAEGKEEEEITIEETMNLTPRLKLMAF